MAKEQTLSMDESFWQNSHIERERGKSSCGGHGEPELYAGQPDPAHQCCHRSSQEGRQEVNGVPSHDLPAPARPDCLSDRENQALLTSWAGRLGIRAVGSRSPIAGIAPHRPYARYPRGGRSNTRHPTPTPTLPQDHTRHITRAAPEM